MTTGRRKVLITGAAGGIGRACARLFGTTHDLVLTDVTAERMDAFASELRDGGYTVESHAGDMSRPAHLGALVDALAGGGPFSVVHAAGLSPALAGWEDIMRVNLVASHLLMNALEPELVAGSAVVLIASMAGHMLPPAPEIEALLAKPLDDGFMGAMERAFSQMGANSPEGYSGASYSYSKRGVHMLAVDRGIAWGPRGVRVTSISPGMIHTPMGLAEIEQTAGAKDVLDLSPVARIGTPLDIAMAAHFLCGEAAGYINATDLKVDGGSTAAIMTPRPEG